MRFTLHQSTYEEIVETMNGTLLIKPMFINNGSSETLVSM